MSPNQQPLMPSKVAPIMAIGAGGIVRNAHWPAYKKAGFPVWGVYDVNHESAAKLAAEFGVERVFENLEEVIAAAPNPCVFDLAVPADQIFGIVKKLPDGAAALIQKPLGENLEQARAIRDLSRKKNLVAAVNFQLRYAPYTLAAVDLIGQGVIGKISEIDVKVNVHTPWALWTFLERAPRMEIVYHSIHYLDFIRSVLGEPQGVYAKTIKHEASPKLHSSRSAIILDYGEWQRATVVTNHGHDFSPEEEESSMRIDGRDGSIVFQMGLNMNYPAGREDFLKFIHRGDSAWTHVHLEGSWFPDAFVGTMASVMRGLEGHPMPTSVEDAFNTMALVEAAYRSSEKGGEVVPD